MKYKYKRLFFLLVFLMSMAMPEFVQAVIKRRPIGMRFYGDGNRGISFRRGSREFNILQTGVPDEDLGKAGTLKQNLISLNKYGDNSSTIVEGALSRDGQRIAILSSYGVGKEQFLWIGKIQDEELLVDWSPLCELSHKSSKEGAIRALEVKFERDGQTVQVLYQHGIVFAYKEDDQEPRAVANRGLFNSNQEQASSFAQEGNSSSIPKDIPDQSDQDVKSDHKDTHNKDTEEAQKKVPTWLQNRMVRLLGIGTVALGGAYLVYCVGKYVVDRFKKKNKNQEQVKKQKQDKKPKGKQDETVSLPAKKKWFSPHIKWINSEYKYVVDRFKKKNKNQEQVKEQKQDKKIKGKQDETVSSPAKKKWFSPYVTWIYSGSN